MKNVGDYDSSEVIQLYVGKNKNSQVFKAKKELKAFSKVFVKRNECKEVVLSFKVEDLTYYNVKESCVARWAHRSNVKNLFSLLIKN